MPKRKDPVNRVMDFFETSPVEQAQSILAVCQWIVAKRAPKATEPRVVRPKQIRIKTDKAV